MTDKPPFNPAMLILARESNGMSQSELAEAASMTQSKVSKYENGMLAISEDDLERIAVTLNFTDGFFCETDKIYGLGSAFLFHRQRKDIPLFLQRKIQAEINILRMQVERLLRSFEIETENEFVQLDIDAHDGDISKIAKILRATWRLPLGPIADLTAAIESAGGIVMRCAFGTKLIDAAHLWLPGLPPLFFVNVDMPGDRLRWTLAHEIGHAIMHRNPSDNMEEQANKFASELLMPENEIGPHLEDLSLEKAASLKPTWKVSMAAIVKTAYDRGRINQHKYRRLFTSLSAQGYRTAEPFPIPVEEPQGVRQLVNLHRKELGYNEFDLAKLLFRPDPQFFSASESAAMFRVAGRPFFVFFPKTSKEINRTG